MAVNEDIAFEQFHESIRRRRGSPLSHERPGRRRGPNDSPQQQAQEASPAETRTGNGNGNGNGYRQSYRRDRNRDNNSNNGGNRRARTIPAKAMPTSTRSSPSRTSSCATARVRTARARQTQGAPATPEQLLTLTGVVFEDGQYRAYLEDLRADASSGSRKAILSRGRISQIDIDAIEYETGSSGSSNNAQRTWVEVGSDLTGKAATPSIAGGDADSGPKLDPNDPNLTPEQRLKARDRRSWADNQRRRV